MTTNKIIIPGTRVFCACGMESEEVETTITPANEEEGVAMSREAETPVGWTKDEFGVLRCTGCSSEIIE